MEINRSLEQKRKSMPNDYLKAMNDESLFGEKLVSLTEHGYVSQDYFISHFRGGFRLLGIKTLSPGSYFKPTSRTVFAVHKAKSDKVSGSLSKPTEGTAAVFEFNPPKYWKAANVLGNYVMAYAIVILLTAAVPSAAYQIAFPYINPYLGMNTTKIQHMKTLAMDDWVSNRNLPYTSVEPTDEEKALFEDLGKYIEDIVQ